MGEVEDKRQKLIGKLSHLVDEMDKIEAELNKLREQKRHFSEEYHRALNSLADVSKL